MSDGFIALLAGIFAAVAWLIGVAWLTILPTIGLLWCIGWLP